MVEKKPNKKYNYAIIVVSVTFLALLLVSFLVVKPLYSGAKKLTKEASDKQTTLNKLKEKKEKLEGSLQLPGGLQ
jgi:predicted PurR-regulated permease PerM